MTTARAMAARGVRGTPKGMTLIEILVVIAIIGIVATVVAVAVVGYFQDAKIEATRTLVTKIGEKVEAFKLTRKRAPESLDELVKAKYIKQSDLKDPWGQELEYTKGGDEPGVDFGVCSRGPDGKEEICNEKDKD